MLPRRVRGKEGDVHKKGSMEHGRNDAGTRRNGETEIRGQKSDDRGQRAEDSRQQCSALIELRVMWLRRHLL
jgi:hypothetical protein